jgi:hypothetical protein
MVTEEHKQQAQEILDLMSGLGVDLKFPVLFKIAIAKALDEAERRGANTGA